MKYALLATVSRCETFSYDVVSTDMLFSNFLRRLRNITLEDGEQRNAVGSAMNSKFMAPTKSEGLFVLI